MITEMVNRAVKTLAANAAWNTGRGYSNENQRMSAEILSGGRVAFLDRDRGLGGMIMGCYRGEVIGESESDPVTLAHFVMREYDAGRYNSGFYELERAGASFEETHALGTRLKAAAESMGRDGVRVPQPHEMPGISDAAVAVLGGYPATATVAELYDDDQEFADALKQLVGPSFEYPDFSYKTVGEVTKKIARENTQQSRWDAEAIAREKPQVAHLDSAVDQTHIGKVIGLTGSHVVLSLGRTALIVKQNDLSHVPENGAEVTVKFDGGKGSVVGRQAANDIER